MTTRAEKTGYWLVTVYWFGTAINVVAGTAMLAWLAMKLIGSVHLGF